MMKQIIREGQGGEEKPWSIKNEIILQEFKGGIDV